jgi:carbamoyl-phosphate synthase large subunit
MDLRCGKAINNNMNIAITGVGGGVGQSILKSLEETHYKLVALDGEPLAVGLYAAETSYVIPYANDENYIPELLEICRKEDISLLFPGLDAELMPLSKSRQLFEEIGTTVVVSDPDVITISDDKQQTYDRLTEVGVNVPATFPAEQYEPAGDNYPIILKQKVGGARSKNVFVAHNSSDWTAILKEIGDSLSDFIVMNYIHGEEYTCGTVNLDGSCKGVIVMRRTLRDGDTHKCFTVKNDVVEAEVRKVVDAIKPFGACNVQLKFNDGKAWIFEINARCSGTTAARTLSGFNEPKMIADFLLKGIEPEYSIREQTILRYWQELVVENETIDQMQKQSFVNAKEPKKL